MKYKVAKLITVPVKLSRTSAAQVKQKTNHRLTQSCQLQTEDAERCSKLKVCSKVILMMYVLSVLKHLLFSKIVREQGYRPFYGMFE